MDWGIFAGLGSGLQAVGSGMLTSKLSEKLEQDRFNREQNKFDPTQTKYKQVDTDGGPLWYEVKYNKAGDVIDQQLAPKNVIDEMEASSKERGLKARLLESQVSNTEYSGKRAIIEDTREDEDRNLLSPEDRRQVARYKGGLDITPAQQLQANTSLQTAAARKAPAEKAPAREQTLSEWATDTINNTPDLHKFVDNGDLTQDQLKNAVAMAGASYARSGTGKPSLSNLRGYIQQMIDEGYYKNPQKKTGAITPSLVLPTKK